MAVTDTQNNAVLMKGPKPTAELGDGFVIVKLPTGNNDTVSFNPKTGVIKPHSNSSRQLFQNPDMERQIQGLVRDEYKRTAINEPILTAESDLEKSQEVLSENETGPALQATLDDQAALTELTAQKDDYNPSVPNAVLNSVTGFEQSPNGLDEMALTTDQLNEKLANAVPPPPPPTPSNIGMNPPIEGALSGNIYNGVQGTKLADPRGPHQIPQNPTMPVLTNTTKPDGSGNGVLSKTVGEGPQRNNGNARGSKMSFNKIGSGEDRTAYSNTPTGEMLMRVGGKIAAGSANGYNSAMNDGIQEYGAIKDGDRAVDTEAYLEQVRQKEVAAEAAADLASGVPVGAPSPVYQKAALNALDQIQTILNADGDANPFDNVTGLIGNFMSAVPQTRAHDVKMAVHTIEAAVGFDRLQAMRDASPTGGALGQVSNIELDLLKSSLGSLRQSSTKKQFQDNLNRIRLHYQNSVKAIEAQQAQYFKSKGGVINETPDAPDNNYSPEVEALLKKYG